MTPEEREDARYNDWLSDLEASIIQGEYGYEPGEFQVFPEQWHGLYAAGLTPAEAFSRALNAHEAEPVEDR